jgi:hypothetical protein
VELLLVEWVTQSFLAEMEQMVLVMEATGEEEEEAVELEAWEVVLQGLVDLGGVM